ncbi:MAG TPA: hypothetical protein VGM92_00970, partial [Candidatus Kapabacteria bacterium]
TADLVWHFDHDSLIQSNAMGYVERLPNGNTFISWGIYAGGTGLIPQVTATEVDSTKKIVFEMNIEEPYVVYRAYKYPFIAPTDGVAPASAITNELQLGEPFPNPSAGISQVALNAPLGQQIELDLFDALGRNIEHCFSGYGGIPSIVDIGSNILPTGTYELILKGTGTIVSRSFHVIR